MRIVLPLGTGLRVASPRLDASLSPRSPSPTRAGGGASQLFLPAMRLTRHGERLQRCFHGHGPTSGRHTRLCRPALPCRPSAALHPPIAQRALQRATRLLALAVGQSLRDLRESPDPLLQSHAVARERSALAALFAEIAELLGGRLDKLPERKRPHYTPAQRWRILEIKRLLAFSSEEAAHVFRVSTGTVLRWEAEAGREPEKRTIGSLPKPTPPLRRYADVVRHRPAERVPDTLLIGPSAPLTWSNESNVLPAGASSQPPSACCSRPFRP